MTNREANANVSVVIKGQLPTDIDPSQRTIQDPVRLSDGYWILEPTANRPATRGAMRCFPATFVSDANQKTDPVGDAE